MSRTSLLPSIDALHLRRSSLVAGPATGGILGFVYGFGVFTIPVVFGVPANNPMAYVFFFASTVGALGCVAGIACGLISGAAGAAAATATVNASHLVRWAATSASAGLAGAACTFIAVGFAFGSWASGIGPAMAVIVVAPAGYAVLIRRRVRRLRAPGPGE